MAEKRARGSQGWELVSAGFLRGQGMRGSRAIEPGVLGVLALKKRRQGAALRGVERGHDANRVNIGNRTERGQRKGVGIEKVGESSTTTKLRKMTPGERTYKIPGTGKE